MNNNAGMDIVCVAQPSWSGSYAKSTVLLMKQMAVNNRVLYVDYAYTLKDLINSFFKKQNVPVFQMLGLKDRIRIAVVRDHKIKLAVLTLPPMLPINFLSQGWLYEKLNSFNGWLASSFIRAAIKRMRFSRPVVINAFAPSLGFGMLNKLDEKSTIYYCYDQISEAIWSGKHGEAMERKFACKTDAVVVSSDSLKDEKAGLNKNIFVVKNGVDANLFKINNAMNNSISRKVVGFIGSLDARIDYKLLKDLIQDSIEFHFRFIGRIVDNAFEELKQLPNVEWISPVPYKHLPALIQKFDIGIIPFVKSAFTEKIYPLKINEYLAMGKPVVMTSFAQLPEFNVLVDRADTSRDFKEAIQTAIVSDNEKKINQRIAFAHNNSWEERAKELNEIIELVNREKE